MSMPSNLLSNAKEILTDLQNDIDGLQKIWAEIRENNPNFEEVSEENWEVRNAQCWLHGATNVNERNELEKWLNFELPLSATAKTKAKIFYHQWTEHILEEGVYADFYEEDLISPDDQENLYDYICKLADQVEQNGWGKKKNKQAIKSFLSYLRKEIPLREIAFLEHIFPEKMDLHNNSIIRLVKPQVFPISEIVAAQIIKTLIEDILHGRKNAQFKKAEALALCWLCLTSSRIRLPKTLESIHSIKISALTTKEEVTTAKIPTIFNAKKLQISQKVANYLKAIANIPSTTPRNTILQSGLHDLRRSLTLIIKKADIPSDLGSITFLTFMSYPHHADKLFRSEKAKIPS